MSISGADDDFRELVGWLADMTGEDTYRRVLGDRNIASYRPLTAINFLIPKYLSAPNE